MVSRSSHRKVRTLVRTENHVSKVAVTKLVTKETIVFRALVSNEVSKELGMVQI